MRRFIGAVLGALAGLAFSTLGLIDTSQGLPAMSGGGNEATPIVIAVGLMIGALLGASVLWRFPIAIVGAIVGLAAGMWLRDNLGVGGVQPPWVFLLLFGLPAVGFASGYLIHLRRSTWARHPALAGALVGLAAAVVGHVTGSILWAAATDDPCEPTQLPNGGLLVPLCPESGPPSWVALSAILLGAAIGHFTRYKLSTRMGPSSEEVARTP